MFKSWKKLVAIAAGVGLFVAGSATAQSGGRATLEPAAQTEVTLEAKPMTGANEVPPVDPGAGVDGVAQVAVNKATGRVCIVFFSDLTGDITGLHIHEGVAGANGGVRVDFLGAGNTAPASGAARCVNSTPAQATAIADNPAGFYVNAHNSTFPSGALRAQLRSLRGFAGELHMLDEPGRASDSRATGGKLAAGATRTLNISQGVRADGSTGTLIFPGARAAIVTLTLSGTENAGYVQLYSASLDAPPRTSSINWSQSGQDIAITTTVAIDVLGNVKVTAGPTGGTHVIIDVVGVYYTI